MTVNASPSSIEYTGDGVSTIFPVPFYVLAAADLFVYRRNLETLQGQELVLGTDYTVQSAGNQFGCQITLSAPLAVGYKLYADRSNIVIEQQTDYVQNDKFPAESTETALDRLTMIAQVGVTNVTRALHYPLNEFDINAEVPPAITRAGKLFGFDANGVPTAVPLPASVGAGDIKTDTFIAGTDFTPGVTTQLTLSREYISKDNLAVFFGSAYQGPENIASIVDFTLTFTAPIPLGTEVVYVRGGTTLSLSVPASNSVTAEMLVEGAAAENLRTSSITQEATNQIYEPNGARVQRLNDRVLIGPACDYDARYPSVQRDWLTELQYPLFGDGGAVPFAQLVTLNNEKAATGITAGAQSKYFPVPNAAAIGVQGYGYANNPTTKQYAWAYYGEGHRMLSSEGSVWGIEIAVVNESGQLVEQTPYGGPDGITIGIQIDSGNGFDVARQPGLKGASSAITIIQNTMDNSAPFLRGIVFSDGALRRAGGVSEAISFYKGCSIQWYAPGGGQTGSIFCDTSDPAKAVHMALDDNTVALSNMQLTGSATGGSAVSIPAQPAWYVTFKINNQLLKIPAYNL